MADKRKLLLEVDVDVDSDELKKLPGDTERAEEGFENLNHGLKKLDRQYSETNKRIKDLREEIKRSGDLDLVKDVRKAENELKKIGRDRKSILGDPPDPSGFVAQLQARLGPLLARMPLSGPIGIALTTAAAAAAPYLGATIASGLLVGAGGAGIVGGLIAAKDDSRVQGAAKGLGVQIGDQLKKATGKEFIDETVRSLEIFKSEVRETQPDLERLVSASGKFLAPLSEGVGKGAASLLSGLADAAEGAEPVFRELGEGIAQTGDAIGDVFRMISDDGASAGLALRDTFTFISGTIRETGAVVNSLTETYGFLRAGQALLTGDTATLVRYIDGEARAHIQAEDAAKAHMQAQEVFNAQIRNTNIDLSAQIGYLNTIRGANLSAAEANVAYRDALDQAKGSVEKKNKVTLDEEKALLSAASAANRNIEALERSGATSDETSSAFNRQREQLIKVATQMGMSRQKATEYIDKLLQIPTNINTKYSTTGIQTELEHWKQLRNAIDQLPDYKKTRYVIETNQVTIRTDAGGKHALASGGPMRAGETYLVGEEGPELVTPSKDGYVHDAKSTMAMARSVGRGSAAMGGGVTQITVPVSAGYIATPAQLEARLEKVVNTLIRKGKLDGVRT